MNDYFRAVGACRTDTETISVTVMDGEAAGEKALINDGTLSYLSAEGGFLKTHEKDLISLSETGVISFFGSELYIERIGREKRLVVCGCGHVSLPIIRLGKTLGFFVTAIDDRPAFTQQAKEAGADEVIASPFEQALREVYSDPFTYFVIVTRGHRWDEACLRVISEKKHAYIGMMGSKARIRVVKENLLNEGYDPEILGSLYAPIGLRIGSETPEEIAVSVMAEIIQVKSGAKDSPFPKDILRAINGSEHEPAPAGRKILATIIRRQGSAPREEGTKMLITENGTVNTIGGGLLEAKVTKKAEEMLRSRQAGPAFLHHELNAGRNEDGEVCGGVIDVMLEVAAE
ncbi:MAG: XdhC family protein [Lachnospiraceae bacterium]|nr:XdhC family protein [Lachnospiraceae bacterium]